MIEEAQIMLLVPQLARRHECGIVQTQIGLIIHLYTHMANQS